MKKLRILAMFVFTLVLFNISTPMAFAANEKAYLEEPYAHVWTESGKEPTLNFDCTAYKSQATAKKYPTIIYSDYFPFKLTVYSVDRFSYATFEINGYGTHFGHCCPKPDLTAYIYIDVKPVSEKPNANTSKSTKSNASLKTSSSSKASSSASSASTATSSSSASKTTTTEKVDFTPVLEQLGKSVDKNTVLSDLDDFVTGKWDGSLRSTEKSDKIRTIYTLSREYAFNGYSASIDYSGNLPQYPCNEYTLVQNGNTIEEWKYFKKIGSWSIPTTDTITKIDAWYFDDNKSYGTVLVTDATGKPHIYHLYENGQTKNSKT